MLSDRSSSLALAAAVLLLFSHAASQSSPSSSSSGSSSSTPASKSQSVSDFEQRLTRINGQIKDLKARIEAEARKESSVLSSLARINLNKSLVQKELAAQNVELERARADLASIQADIPRLSRSPDRPARAAAKGPGG